MPRLFFGLERALPRGGEAIEARLAIAVSRAPRATKEPALFEAHQRRIQRAHVDLQGALRDLLEARRDGVAVRRAEDRYCLQHHQIERALQDVGLPGISICHANGIARALLEGQMDDGTYVGCAELQV